MAWRRVTTPSRHWARLGRRFGIGHRAAFLLMFGAIYVAVGAGVIFQETPSDPYLFHTRFPVVFRVALWAVCGGVAIATCRTRWQWLGFMALVPPPLERLASYMAALITDAVETGGPPIPWPYLTGALLYLLIYLAGRLASSWPDPPGEP